LGARHEGLDTVDPQNAVVVAVVVAPVSAQSASSD